MDRRDLKVIFMGTPEFAVPCLAALHADDNCEVIGVYTQPDKPRGRGQKLLPSPVKAWAEEHGLPVHQPVKIKTEEATAELRGLKPDLVVVVAFGQILSQEILDIPPHGCINVHGSLLPRYRGAAPMQWCVINGETKTGITTMMMDAGLDTGDMLLKEELTIGPDMTLEEVHDNLMEMGAQVLMKTIEELRAGTLKRGFWTFSLMSFQTSRISARFTSHSIHSFPIIYRSFLLFWKGQCLQETVGCRCLCCT